MSDSDSEISIPSDTEAMKLFASDEEYEFSGFSAQSPPRKNDKNKVSENTEANSDSNVNNKDGESQAGPSSSKPNNASKGKGPGQNKKGKAPMKRKISDESSEQPKKPKKSKSSKKKNDLEDFSSNMEAMFSKFTDNLLTAISLNQAQNSNSYDHNDDENLPSTNGHNSNDNPSLNLQ